MPVKVQCPSCQKVVNAPDRARGKVLKCPQCKSRVKVPMGRRKTPAGAVAGPTDRPRRERSAADEDLLSGLDLSHAEDRSVKLCPRCAVEVTEDDIECPKCGVEIATGVLSEKQRHRRKRKGPDQDEYWNQAWSQSWKFLKQNWRRGMKLAVFLLVFGALAAGCGAARQQSFDRYVARIVASVQGSSEITISETGIHITADVSGTDFLGKRYQRDTDLAPPLLLAAKTPPVLLLSLLTTVFAFCFLGTIWSLWIAVIDATAVTNATMNKTKLDRLKFDLFATVNLGIKCFFWPIFLLLPLLLIIAPLFMVSQGLFIAAAVLLILVGLVITPVALTHMATKYTYQAWLIVPMLRITAKNLVPALYWLMIAVVALLPVIVVAGVCAAVGPQLMPTIQSLHSSVVSALAGITGQGPGKLAGPAYGVLGAVVGVPLLVCLSLGLVFVMRANGVFAYYFAGQLELVHRQGALVPAPFGPRYIAFVVDLLMLPLQPLLTKDPKTMTLTLLLVLSMILAILQNMIAMVPVMVGLLIVACGWSTWAVQESSYEQCTIGKNSLGLMVVDMDGRRLTPQQGARRFIGRLLTLGIGFLPVLFNKNRWGLHDMLAKSQCVWRGDDDRTE